ncbi:hypothetical protein Tco_0627764 [Tanacetum coccineum]|uniref:Uncharacterized protein n=1 Tax=Tanacetum coccineum TaxID=301880 RepID=A0ABQ4WNG7_9ASTR
MLEVLMNEIACDLRKAIQQHPGDKEIESIKLQTRSINVKRHGLFDAQFDHVKVVSTVEEPSSVLPANDIPSFDLGLTPTPSYVNVNVDKDVSNQGMSTIIYSLSVILL